MRPEPALSGHSLQRARRAVLAAATALLLPGTAAAQAADAAAFRRAGPGRQARSRRATA
jgi:hypothetical protein